MPAPPLLQVPVPKPPVLTKKQHRQSEKVPSPPVLNSIANAVHMVKSLSRSSFPRTFVPIETSWKNDFHILEQTYRACTCCKFVKGSNGLPLTCSNSFFGVRKGRSLHSSRQAISPSSNRLDLSGGNSLDEENNDLETLLTSRKLDVTKDKENKECDEKEDSEGSENSEDSEESEQVILHSLLYCSLVLYCIILILDIFYNFQLGRCMS